MLPLHTEETQTSWRSPYVWGLVVAVIVIGLVVATEPPHRVPWFQRGVLAVTTPMATVATATRRWFHRWWQGDASRRLEALEQQLRIQDAALIAAEQWRRERDELRALLSLSDATSAPRLGAEVIHRDLSAPYQTAMINRGRADGVEPGMIAVAGGGLAGRVERVAPHHAVILLLNDPTHAVDVLVQGTHRRGILMGAGDRGDGPAHGAATVISYLVGEGAIAIGSGVVTSGLDGRYPAGIPVGRVMTVMTTDDGVERSAVVVPFVEMHRLDRVGLLPPLATAEHLFHEGEP
ncbi:MAG: rod shape-determining protein MreC [Deltaproteobacteria bacterium]|nr:rod shape-determining protein MreC [Deltaproteobacteria bacterium]